MKRNGASPRCRKPCRKQSKRGANAPTSLARQYDSLKRQAAGALLCFLLSHYYVLFYEDAVTAARELEMTVTRSNDDKGEGVPMLQLDRNDAAELHLTHLLQRGHRVAICDQAETCSARSVTPGTATERRLLGSCRKNSLLGTPEGAGFPNVICISKAGRPGAADQI